MTARTQRLLMLETLPEVQAFIDTHRAFPLKRQTVVTCIATLNKSHPEVMDPIQVLIVKEISRREVWLAWSWAQRALPSISLTQKHCELLNLAVVFLLLSSPQHNHGQPRATLAPSLSQRHWSLRCRVPHSCHMQVCKRPQSTERACSPGTEPSAC